MGEDHRAPPPEQGIDGDVMRRLVDREAFLAHLESGPAAKPALIDSLEVSRSTVDRVIREARAADFVEKREASYRLTPFGRVALACLRWFRDDLANAASARGSLLSLPKDASLDPAFFRGGSVISEVDDERPGKVLREQLASAEAFWVVTRSPHFELLPLARRKVLEEDMAFTLIHSEATVERLRLHHPETLEATLASGNLDLYALEVLPPFGLIKSGDSEGETVILILYGQQSEPETLVVNDSPAAVERFDDRFWDYRARATLIGLEHVT